ncbi:hypothetical protein OIC43_41720 [Streptomyces sp. NBC_00825]|uniref:hypothetical protein n=1 Tax=unclassified Streptomyces TaxID=2593676 RepID=UPI002ED63AF7|nr:hypothetical protein OG832_01965 [Streptomyces sp. NBC_00826]WTH95092.1 hypothetical protein OIC43_41720 [Streptomyces sp. NBC_00825]WTI03826.1 hypothetical protein OHA23_41695 [Streptomyces sp. NBC_00822]
MAASNAAESLWATAAGPAAPAAFEHSCLRCSLLRPGPDQRRRIVAIRANLLDRIAEAEREGRLGEVEGLKASLVGAEDDLARIDRRSHSRTTVGLGMPMTRSEDH